MADTLADRVEAAYRRVRLFGKRRRLMEEWAAFCGQPIRRGDVAPLRAAAGT